VSIRWVIVMSLLMSACGAAADVGSSAAPTSLGFVDEASTTPQLDGDQSSPTTAPASTSVSAESDDQSTDTTDDTSPDASTSSTTETGNTSTVPAADPNADFCLAAIRIDALGTFVALDDTEAASVFFNDQADRWRAAADVAPPAIATDVGIVATFSADLRTLLAANDFDLFAVFEALTELEVASGADMARIRANQFIYANCEVEPPLPEQATAAFYGELLVSTEDRQVLAELLASAEVFTLEGARCFVDRATTDVMHPLVGAPATTDQTAALSSILGTCQISIGT